MFKKLLSFAAAVILAVSANAEVLWESATAEGVLVDWGEPCLVLQASEAADIAAGDYIKLTVTGVTEGGWPQVALNKAAGGWPPLCNEGVGGREYPAEVSFPVTFDLYQTIHAEGLMVNGNGAYVSKVEHIKGEPITPFTVWFGNKACGWGNGVSLPAALFKDVEANGMLSFYTSDQSFQILLGGWSGLNLPSYAAAGIPNMTYEDGITTVTFIEEYASENEYDQDGEMKSLNVFELMKENGVVMHGTTTLTRIDYIPGKLINEYNADVESVNALATALQEFNNNVAEEFPGFAVLHADEIAALTATIEALNDKVTAAMEAAYETGVYNGLTGVEVTEANETLIGLVAAEEEAVNAIIAESEEDTANISELANAFQEFCDSFEAFPGFLVAKAEEIAAMNATIEALNNKVVAALEAAFETGVYNGLGGEMAQANEQFMGLMASATELYNELAEQTTASEEEIDELVAAYEEFIATTTESFPGYLVLKADEVAALGETINGLYEDVLTAISMTMQTGKYEAVPQEQIVAATEALMSLSADVEAVSTAIEEDYNGDIDNINTLANALQEFNNQVAEEFPGYAVLHADEFAALTAAVEAFNNAAAAGLENAFATGVYEGPVQAEIVAANQALMALAAGFEPAVNAIQEDYDGDVENIHALATALQEFNTQIEEEFPGYAVLHADELAALTVIVEELNSRVTAALENAFETGVYNGPAQADVVAATEKLMALAADFEPTIAAIQADYDGDIDNINTLANALQEFNNQVAEEFPGYAVLHADEIAALTAAVEAFNNQATEALANAFENGVYEGPVQAEIVAANEALMALAAGIEPAVNAIQEDYDGDIDNINTLANALQEFNNQVAEEFPGYAVLHADEIAALTAAVEAFNNQATEALAKAFETGVYEGPAQAEIVAANEALMSLAAGIEPAIAAIQEEYDADVENINELANALQEFNTEIAENFPAFATLHADEIAALTATVEALNTQVATALENVFTTGVYEGPAQADVVAATETLMALAGEASAALQAIEDAIYEEEEALAPLFEGYEEFVAELEAEFPAFLNKKEAEFDALAATLEGLGDKVAAAADKALNETGVYEELPAQEVQAATDAFLALVTECNELSTQFYNQANEDLEEVWALLEVYDALADGSITVNDEEEDLPFKAFYDLNEDEMTSAYYDIVDFYNNILAAYDSAYEETCEYVTPASYHSAVEKLMALTAKAQEEYMAIINDSNEDLEMLNEDYYSEIADIIEGEVEVSDDTLAAAQDIMAKLSELLEAVNAAKMEALDETGEYVSPITRADIRELNALLKALASGIEGLQIETTDAIYYDLNGQQIANPAAGKVYIRVINGKASKVLVK